MIRIKSKYWHGICGSELVLWGDGGWRNNERRCFSEWAEYVISSTLDYTYIYTSVDTT